MTYRRALFWWAVTAVWFILMLGAASAQWLGAPSVSITSSCSGRVCSTIITPPYRQPRARIIQVEPGEPDPEWVERCQPRLVRDEFGVGRWVYKHKGCEFGQ